MTRWVALAGMLGLMACDPDCSSMLEVVVADEDGERVPEASCRIDDICCKSMSPPDCAKPTNSDGRAIFHFASADCTVVVEKPGFATATENHRFPGCNGIVNARPVLRRTSGQ